jgi:hypothetical protein
MACNATARTQSTSDEHRHCHVATHGELHEFLGELDCSQGLERAMVNGMLPGNTSSNAQIADSASLKALGVYFWWRYLRTRFASASEARAS